MKKGRKTTVLRVLPFLLLVILMAGTTLHVKAANKDADMRNDAACTVVKHRESGTADYVNPLYKNYKIKVPQQNGIRTYAGSSEVYTWNEAVKYFKEQANARNASITFSMTLPTADVGDTNKICNKLFDAACADDQPNAGGDYLRYSVYKWSAGYGMETTQTNGIQMTQFEIQMNMVYFSNAAQEKALNEKLSSVEKGLQLDGLSVYEKTKKIYTYVEKNVTYDYAGLDDATDLTKFSAYGALVEKSAVCQGYASLLYRMLEDNGIDSRIISSNTLNHAWNIACLNDLYYYADVTWDSNIYESLKQESYKYFLKGKEDFADHASKDSQYSDETFAERYPLGTRVYNADDPEEPKPGNSDFTYEMENGELIITSYTGSDENVVVPAKINGHKVKKISQYAFQNNEKIKTLEIAEGVDEITSYFVGQCKNLEKITLPSTAKLVTGGAGLDGFVQECTSLKEIKVPENHPYLTVIDGGLYNKECTELIAYPTAARNEAVRIPDGVTTIKDKAFEGNKWIKNVTLPDTIKNIGNYAFNQCSELSNISYDGTKEQWNAIKIGEENDFTNTKITYRVDICQHEWGTEPTILREATCTAPGRKEYTCTLCGEKTRETIPALGHILVKNIVKATTGKNGKITEICDRCKEIISENEIVYPKTIALSASSFTYNGKTQNPKVTVKDANGKLIPASAYKITWAKASKNVGKYTVKIVFTGNYSGTVSKNYSILPKGTTIKALSAGSKKMTVKWNKQTVQTTGYQIQYAASAKFQGAKTITVSKNKTVSTTVKKLNSNKKYYVRIRTYKTANGAKYYANWSAAKSVKVKK